MEVCEVCGAFLIVGDAQSRVDDHLMGKQHMGYAKIKSTVEELKVKESPQQKHLFLLIFFKHSNCCHSCLGETTTALRRSTRRKPGCPEGQRRPRARKGGTGEKAQRGGREGKGAGEGTREGAGERTREGERQGTGPRKRKEGAPKPLEQPPLQSDFRQEEEQIS